MVAVVNPNNVNPLTGTNLNPDGTPATQAVYRYAQGNNFSGIRRYTDNPDGTVQGNGARIMLAAPGTPNDYLSGLDNTTVNPYTGQTDRAFKGFNRIPIAVNPITGQLALALAEVYTTTNDGDIVSRTITDGFEGTGPVSALAYGGRNPDGSAAPDVLYWARNNAIYVRTGAGATFTYDFVFPDGTSIKSIVLDPNNWQVAYAAGDNKVFATVNGGQSWTDITGNLGADATGLDTVQIVKIPGPPNQPQKDALLVGGANGVFVSYNPLGVPNGTNNYQRSPGVKVGIATAPNGATEVGSTVTLKTAPLGALALSQGSTVTITGVGVAGYNGTFTVASVLSATSFTYTDPITGLAPSGGGGVSRPTPTWSPLNGPVGNVLPNAVISQISYTPPMTLATPSGPQARGDVLLISTLGRGVYQMNNASTVLGQPAVLTITGPTAGSQVLIQPDAVNPALTDVVVTPPSGSPTTTSYPTNLVSSIQVSNLGAATTLTIDTRLQITGGITFDGGGNANLAFKSPQTAYLAASSPVVNGQQFFIVGPNSLLLTVTYTNGTGTPANLPAPQFVQAAAFGLQRTTGLRIGNVRGPNVGPLANLVATVAGGAQNNNALLDADPDGGDPDGGGDAGEAADASSDGPGIFEQLFEQGTSGLDLGSITSIAQLQQFLIGLSDSSTPGSFTPLANGEYDVTINKTLDGTVPLDFQALGGTVTVAGSIDLTATVHVHMVFGVDSEGFYIDAGALVNAQDQPTPIMTVNNIQVEAGGDFSAVGDFGIFNITASDPSFSIAPGIGLAVYLPLQSLDSVTGQIGGHLYVPDFAAITDQATTSLISSPGQTVALTANIQLGNALGSLGPYNLTFTFNDLNDPTNVTVSGPGFSSIGQLINESKGDILQGLQQLGTLGNNIDASGVMNTTLPVLNRTLGSYVQLGAIFNTGLYQPVQAYFATFNDLHVTLANGMSIDVSLVGAATIGDVIADLNTAGNPQGAQTPLFTAALSPNDLGLELTDMTSGNSPFTVTALNASPAATELGILGTGSNKMIVGSNLTQGPALTSATDLSTLQGITFTSEELPTVSGLLNAITGGSVTASNGDLSLSLAPGLSVSVSGANLMLNYAFTATRIDPVALDLSVGGASPLSLNAALAVNFQTQFSFNGSIGVNLTQVATNPLAAFFVQLPTPPTITASIFGSSQGVQFAGAGQNDLQINFHNGTSVPVSLNGADTIADVLSKLNAAAPGKLTAAISASGLGLVLTDLTSGQSAFTVTALNDSPAAAELGILAVPESNGTIQGTNLSQTTALTPTILLAALPLGGGLSVNANIGALQVGGQVLGLPVVSTDPDSPRLPLLQASVSVGLAADPSGKTTLNALIKTPVADLITPSGSLSLGLDIPITASLQFASGRGFDFTAGGQPELIIQSPNLFSTAPIITPENFSTLLSVKNVTAASLLAALEQFSTYLAQYANSKAFTMTIPFTKNTTLGSVVNLAAAFANELAGLTAPDGEPEFTSIQGLAQDTTTDPITFNFVPSFQTTTNGTVPALELTFNYTDQFGGSLTGQITGNILSPVIDDTAPLSTLNGGKGVQFSTTGGADLSIALSNGTTLPITFSNPTTVGDVINQINSAPGNNGQVAASINPDGNGLVLTDLTLPPPDSSGSLFNVLGVQGSSAALNLGLVGIGFGNPTLTPTTPLSHLNNGAGVSFSTPGSADLMVTLSNGTTLPIGFNNNLTASIAAALVGPPRVDLSDRR